ncbi:hypothetical protein J8273_1880 [Carpediemonas membranifera]|nr:hypothetical protein J8273_1880 [Carpediemonas membranifera]|eukprot:KAG9396835.1 hypothetical protein J8273_1880 [Carpediemonas membranifera]
MPDAAGYHVKLKTILETMGDQYLTIEAVSFSSTADLVSKLRTLADLYANFDTYWVISGHTETSTSRLVIDAATNDALFLHNFVELITAAFKEPTVVDQTRVRMIYFATCTRDNDTAETTELMKTISTKPYRHTCIILTPEQVLANELHLQDCFWIYRTLCMDNPLLFLSRYFSGYRNAPGAAGRRLIANGSLSSCNAPMQILGPTKYVSSLPLPSIRDHCTGITDYKPLETNPSTVLDERFITQMTQRHAHATRTIH